SSLRGRPVGRYSRTASRDEKWFSKIFVTAKSAKKSISFPLCPCAFVVQGFYAFCAGWQNFRIAHLSTGDKIGVEIFEFNNQENPENNFEYWKTGIFNFCVQDPDVEGLAEKIVAAGGKRRMEKPRFYYPGEKPCRMIYMEDPFGNILEIYSHSYELKLVPITDSLG
ncbi:VOC family protein, partial [Endozoicomonas sp. ONNA2]|uniref:VOC family protein n=1 Tax=Endozoicomonas sp. ONNA2 TaxID=2828741 RepID=UPI0035A04B04